MSLPASTVTFLFTDIEGSTRLLQELGDRFFELLTHQREIIEDAARAHGGTPFGTEGDAVFAVFPEALSAIQASAEAQRGLAAHTWPDGRAVRVRMGLHTGEATLLGKDYVGLTLHQVARITAAGHGGQILLSSTTAELTRRGLPPGLELRDLGEHRLKDLYGKERLFQLDVSGLGDRFPALRTLEGRPNNLPLQITSFIGRQELVETTLLLSSNRLLTLTGPGGTGKTRLALQLAAEMSEAFPDGVFFVALDAVREPDLVPSEIAQAIGLPMATSEPPLRLLIGHLRSKQVLLVLDNFEQVVDSAGVVADLLREAPRLKVVVTSRIPLRISGEQEFPVPALGVPQAGAGTDAIAQSEAVRLFIERAMAAQPSFQLTAENAAAVAEITRRLDGLPLAIELAASRLRIFPVEALRTRLDQRLGVLTGGARDLPARQQTLRGAIDWSYDLLDDPDRHLFGRFAVFAGGGFLPEVESICGPAEEIGRDVLDGLDSLVEKSLLIGRPDPRIVTEARFAMLATIQEYAVERLGASGEEPHERRRHAAAFLDLVEDSAPHLTGPDSARRLDRLEADHDNVRAALDWAVTSNETEMALRFIAAAWRFWQIRGHLAEARDRIDRVLAMPDVGQQSERIQARAFGASGSIAYWRGENDQAHIAYAAALEHARACGDSQTIGDALYDLAFIPEPGVSSNFINFDLGGPLLVEALEHYEALGDQTGVAKTTWALSVALAAADRVPEALERVEEALRMYRAIQDGFGIGWSLHMRSIFHAQLGRLDEAEADLHEALPIFAKSNDLTGITGTLLDFAQVAGIREQNDRYWRLRGAVERLRKDTGMQILFEDIPAVNWTLKPRPENDPEVDVSWAAGERLTTDEAIAYALDVRPSEDSAPS